MQAVCHCVAIVSDEILTRGGIVHQSPIRHDELPHAWPRSSVEEWFVREVVKVLRIEQRVENRLRAPVLNGQVHRRCALR